MSGSLLAEMIRRTGTELWCDWSGPDELAAAIAHGATGATSNPPIVLGVVRGEADHWRRRIRTLATERPTATELDLAWVLTEEIAVRGAALLQPVFEASSGRRGRLSAQVDPRLWSDADAMLAQAERLAGLAPNLQVKLPVTTAGLVAIEEATARGIEVNATLNFTVPGAIAVAEAVERGLARREASRRAAGVGSSHQPVPVCTLMFGRLDDWVKAAAERDEVLLTPGVAEWAGVAVFKRAHRLFRERGYRTRLLGGAFRHHLPWSQLLGDPNTILTIPPAWRRWFDGSGLPVESRLEEPVAPAILDELRARSPEFVRAFEPDGIAPQELERYGAAVRTLRQFLAASTDLQAFVRDTMLPDPDRPPAP